MSVGVCVATGRNKQYFGQGSAGWLEVLHACFLVFFGEEVGGGGALQKQLGSSINETDERTNERSERLLRHIPYISVYIYRFCI